MRVLIDTNVLLDAIFLREPFCGDSKKIFSLVREEKIVGCVSVQSLKDIFYLCKRSNRFKDPLQTVEKLSFIFEVIDVNGQDSMSALMSGMEDYEDGLLAFSAQRNNIDGIITRNGKDFYDSDIAIIDPKDIEQYVDVGVDAGNAIIDELYYHIIDVKYGKDPD